MNLDNIKRYYLSFLLFTFSQGIVGVFLNLFFFSSGSYAAVLYFQLALTAGLFLMFTLSGYLMNRFMPRDLFIAGEVFRVAILITLIVAIGYFSNVMIFGFIYGLSSGLFWAGSNNILYDITLKKNRFALISTINALSSVIAMISPLFGGTLVQFAGTAGSSRFVMDFAVAAAVLLSSVLAIRKLDVHNIQQGKKFRLKDTLIKVHGYSDFKSLFFFSQLFAVPFSIVMPIYVFQITSNYFLVGVYVSFTLLVSTVSGLIFRRGFKRWNAFVRVGIVATIASSLFLVFPSFMPPPINVFFFSFVYALVNAPLNNKATTNFLVLVEKEHGIDRSLFWINREYYLNFSRLGICLLLLAIVALPAGTLLVIYLFPLLSFYGVSYLKTANEPSPKLLAISYNGMFTTKINR